MSDVVIVASSPGERSRLEAVTNAVRDALVEAGLPVRVLQLRDLPESALLAGDRAHPRVRWSRLLLAGASAVVVVTPCYERAGSALVHSWLELVAPDLTGVLQVVGLGAFRAHSSGLDAAFATAVGGMSRLPACFLLDKWLLPEADRWRLGAAAAARISACARTLVAELDPGFAARLAS
ncbi:NADPH-dependent FMN reductase [Saccharopolyspora rectivirgula]|jgi:FMN reductase|uniref:NADPH-dependent FMN reductase n=1 Tax=Saccharopolyspora rectivirgula TaxID=28042 RepID=UPI00040B0F6F|nr:NAD(P)H-dependent oxidoreductase [Saccharopolyspora rectivirgula]